MTVSATTVTQYYTGIFRQAPTAAVSSAYQAMANDNAALNSMLSAANLSVDPVVRLYQTAFNRLPDNAGFTAWVVPFSTGGITLQAIANGFTQSTEFTTLYPTSMTNSQFVGALYWNILQRQGEDAGIAGWVNALNSGALTRAQVLLGFSDSAEFTKKIEPNVNAFLTNIATTALANQGTASLYSGNLFDVSGGAPGATYALTTNADTINAESNALVTGTGDSTPTLQAIDTITGTGTNEVIRITYTATNTDATNGALISGMDIFQIRNTGPNAAGATNTIVSLDASKDVGLTTASSYLSTGNVAVTNLAAGARLAIVGNNSIVNGGLTGTYSTATSAVTLDLSGGVKQASGNAVAATSAGAGSVAGVGVIVTGNAASATVNSLGTVTNTTGQLNLASGNTITSLTINAAASLTVAPTAASVGIVGWLAAGTNNTLTISGAASTVPTGQLAAVNLDLLDSSIKNIDASGLTAGGISAKLNNVASIVKGGAGNDTITTNGVQTGAVDGGAGTDRLIVSAAADVATAPGAKFTNFEILRNTGGGATLDVSKVAGITAIELGATGQGATAMTAVQAAAVTNVANNDTLTLALATATGTSDVLTVNLTNSTATTSADLTTATVDGFETINIVSNTGSFADINTVSFASAANLKNLNFSGAKPIVTTATSSVAVNIDASALTAVGATATEYTLTQSGTLVKGSIVTGSAAADSLTTQLAAVTGTTGDFVTYNAGAGNDLITSVVAAINNTSAANASVKIDGGDGTDTLSLAAGTAMVDNNFQYLTNIEKLTFTGNNKIDITTGGFFDTNFKANGVTITAADLGLAGGTTAVANVLNASTFTGNVTATLTQSATGTADVGDSFTVTTNSGNDTITLTVTETLTNGSQVVINTNGGNDTVALTIPALAAGTVTVNLGAGNDTLTAGVAAGIYTGGTGADTMTGGAGVDKFVQTMGASVAATANTLATTIANGNTITFANGVDTIKSFTSTTDKIDTDIDSSGGGAAAIVNGVGQLASAVQTSNFYFRGDFLNGVFTISATGADTLVSLGKAASTLTFADATDYVLLVGVTSVANADFI